MGKYDEHAMFRGGILSGYGYLHLQVDKLLDCSDLWVLEYLLPGDTMHALSNLWPLENHLVLATHLMCLLQHFLRVQGRVNDTFYTPYCLQLQKIYNDAIDSQSSLHQALLSSSVHAMILEILCSMGEVHIGECSKLISGNAVHIQCYLLVC